MSKERPFENINPVPNIRVGYFEKEAYLEVIDEQARQIESFAWQIMALQSRIDRLEKSQRPQGKWINQEQEAFYPIECSNCHNEPFCNDEGYKLSNYCPNCGAKMDGGEDNEQ